MLYIRQTHAREVQNGKVIKKYLLLISVHYGRISIKINGDFPESKQA
jgi:hypothetical protein